MKWRKDSGNVHRRFDENGVVIPEESAAVKRTREFMRQADGTTSSESETEVKCNAIK